MLRVRPVSQYTCMQFIVHSACFFFPLRKLNLLLSGLLSSTHIQQINDTNSSLKHTTKNESRSQVCSPPHPQLQDSFQRPITKRSAFSETRYLAFLAFSPFLETLQYHPSRGPLRPCWLVRSGAKTVRRICQPCSKTPPPPPPAPDFFFFLGRGVRLDTLGSPSALVPFWESTRLYASRNPEKGQRVLLGSKI